MKLYRPVKDPEESTHYAWNIDDDGIDDWINPIEITEEEIESIIEDYREDDGNLYSYTHKWIAKAILSKLKGE